jgi:hypothetical protein
MRAARVTEGLIHVATRRYLHSQGWRLIAGQYPGGSDDDLHTLYVVDTTVARDDSPDPRRHSTGKLVPDIVALFERTLMIVEAKVSYSLEDRSKLVHLLTERRADLLTALRKFAIERRIPELLPVETLELAPALAFAADAASPHDDGLIHILVQDIGVVRCERPSIARFS